MNKAWMIWISVALMGALGSLARLATGELWRVATAYPAGTLTVNLLGALSIGWVNTRFGSPESSLWRYALGVGLLGGFTTFSAMMWDADKMLTDNQFLKAALYLSASLFLGLVAVRCGSMLAKI